MIEEQIIFLVYYTEVAISNLKSKLDTRTLIPEIKEPKYWNATL